MLAFIRAWLAKLRARLTRFRQEDAPAPDQCTIDRFDRIERRLDAMIVERAGRDFLERAMLNREGAPK